MCLSVVWDFWWKRRPPQFRKRFPHCPHTYGFSPVWIRKCRVSAPEWRNRTPHTEHEYGRSPVCMRKCVFKFSMRLKSRPHSLQWYGLQPGGNNCCLTGLPAFPALAGLAALTLCRWLWCLRRSLARLNEWPQILHWWILVGMFALIWTSSFGGAGWTRWVLATDWYRESKETEKPGLPPTGAEIMSGTSKKKKKTWFQFIYGITSCHIWKFVKYNERIWESLIYASVPNQVMP